MTTSRRSPGRVVPTCLALLVAAMGTQAGTGPAGGEAPAPLAASTVAAPTVTELASPAVSAVSAVSASSCAQLEPSDVVGWWKGEDQLTAEIGPELVGTAGFADAQVGRGFELTGTILGTSSLPAVTDAVTVEAWVRPERTGTTQTLLSRWEFQSPVDSTRAYALVLTADEQLQWLTDERSALRERELRAAVPGIHDGQWHHVAATWDQTEMIVYLDGVAIATGPSQGGTLNAAADTPWRVGSSAGAGNPLFLHGRIDEPTVIRRALTAAEIAAIHGAGAAGKCPPASFQELAEVLAPDGAAGDRFGQSVAADAGTVLVGAFSDDHPGAAGSGSAHVLVGSGSTWSHQAKLVAADFAANDSFGWSVDLDGDTAVVGTPGRDDGGDDAGAAYVFVRSGTTWAQQAKLTAADAAAGAEFGHDVTVDGDTIVVGAPGDDGVGSDAGAVYVFSRTDGTWSAQAKLTAADAGAGDRFGHSVDLSLGRLVAGAPFDDAAAYNAGAAYVFTSDLGPWAEIAKLVAGDARAYAQLGWDVAVDGATVVAAADADDSSAVGAGSVYVFVPGGDTWAQQAKLVSSGGAGSDQLGWSVALGGDVVVAGAPYDDGAGASSGSVQVFLRSGTTWTQRNALTASDAATGAGFGWSVALDGATLVVGAAYESHAGAESGSVYFFGR